MKLGRCRPKKGCLRMKTLPGQAALTRVSFTCPIAGTLRVICATEEGSAEASNPNAEQLLGPELLGMLAKRA